MSRSIVSRRLLQVSCVLAAWAVTSAAWAQPTRPDTKVPETAQPETTGQAPAENLSDRLERSKGVIRPPDNVDPEIHVTPPEATRDPMPVIPPPGSPGGDQSIQPK
jgi:hypothetical protein